MSEQTQDAERWEKLCSLLDACKLRVKSVEEGTHHECGHQVPNEWSIYSSKELKKLIDATEVAVDKKSSI